MPPSTLRLRDVRENNLRGFDLDLPHDRLIVVTGLSGSGKSSLAHDTIFREAERRYLATLSAHARRLFGRLGRPAVASIEGVRPAIAVDQRSVVRSPRSTVGTLSELGDELRLLFARFGTLRCAACDRVRSDGETAATNCSCGALLPALRRSLFSFNTPEGACPDCRGLGVGDRVDPELLVADPTRSLRDGALVPTTPNGYIVYSQVAPDAMDTVCRAHGFDIDTPWNELSDEQRHVIFFGSTRVEVPFGKHPLESRMKWSGIKAKPREPGHYRGLVPVIRETLEKKRNDNILRFVRSVPCTGCGGTRLSPAARAVQLDGLDPGAANALGIAGVGARIREALADHPRRELAGSLVERIESRSARLSDLGLGHLQLSRPAATLSRGEARRLHLATQLGCDLSGVCFVFDEPGAGAHPEERARLARILTDLRNRGTTVLLVEHDPVFRQRADHVVEIGPGAGPDGGQLVYSGPPRPEDLAGTRLSLDREPRVGAGTFTLRGASGHDLQGVDATFLRGALNVVTGPSGAGKTTLVDATLARALAGDRDALPHDGLEGTAGLTRVVLVDQREIGRSSRSNPSTYSGVFEGIRQLFAGTPEAQARGFDKGRFSFNRAGGRCERCEGAGVETIGLMSLPAVTQTCGACDGLRFDADTLAVHYRGLSVRDVLDRTVAEAAELFADQPKLARVLDTLVAVGLGYLQLGQPAPTLSGGEAQRLRLASELARSGGSDTVLLLDEPTTGLQARDVTVLVRALDALIEKGATVIAVEHDLGFVAAADHVVDLGPGAGPDGGRVVATGSPREIAACRGSATGRALARATSDTVAEAPAPAPATDPGPIVLGGVRTRNLKGVDVAFEPGLLHVVTGPSGSGKSALAFDTLAAEGRRRFAESTTPYLRRGLTSTVPAVFDSARGLRPTVALRAGPGGRDPRSTVGTFAGLDEALRLLFARLTDAGSASHFSFNHALGACPRCDGRGRVERGDVERLVVDPGLSLGEGALEGTKPGRFLFERAGRTFAVLRAVARVHGLDLDRPWRDLPDEQRARVVSGTGEERYDVDWEEARAKGEETFRFTSTWAGVEPLLAEDYGKKRERKAGAALLELMREADCPDCGGARLAPGPAGARVADTGIAELRAETVAGLDPRLAGLGAKLGDPGQAVLGEIRRALAPTLARATELGLGYLTLDRRTESLSRGELRRLSIAKHLVEGLADVIYVLDEPCAGLHATDRRRLARSVRDLADGGNTVVVVEHDLDFVRGADRVWDLGPGSGPGGGELVAAGTPDELAANPASLTGRFLAGEETVRVDGPGPARPSSPGPRIRGARLHNLRSLDLELDLAQVVALAGPSGSGKSTLVFDVLAASLEAGRAVGCDALENAGSVRRVVRAETALANAGPHGLVATALDLLDPLRTLYAKTPMARDLGLSKSAFSFLSKAGRCPACQGSGDERVVLDFLPDASRPCPTCLGSRFAATIHRCRLDDLALPDVLALSAREASALDFLPPKLQRALALLEDIGLGHLSLDRRTDSLSSGERQRLSLIRELGAGAGAPTPTLFLFDEPALGLHPADQSRLATLFHRLADQGHGVLFTDHSPQLLATADRLLTLGPGGGPDGGRWVDPPA